MTNTNESSEGQAAAAVPKRRGMRLWIPLVIIALAVANQWRLGHAPELDSNFVGMQAFFTWFGAFVLILLWFVFLSRVRWRFRLLALALVILGGFGLRATLRFDGSLDGRGVPRIAWRWSPRKTGVVDEAKRVTRPKDPSAGGAEADYPEYLGRARNGVAENSPLERDWTAHPPQELWRQPVGLAWSSFAVAGSRAITQEQRGENELVVCYELATGQTLWLHTNLTRFSDPMGGDGPRATPGIAGGRVYALGATGILDCLDLATGKSIWSRDTLKEVHGANLEFGKSSSPLVLEDLVVVTGGMANNPTLLAFRREDGAPAWTAGTEKASYGSPALVTLAGRRQILSMNAGTVTAHDPKDGRILWSYAWGDGKWPKCTQPLVLEPDRVLLSGSFGYGCVLLQVKAAPDGGLSVGEVWKNRNMKSEFSNLVARGGFLYGLDDGILACVDLATGERKWKDGRYGHGQVMLAGDLLVVQSEPGAVALVEASPERYHEVARLGALNAKTWNTPALAGDFLLVRNDQEAVCYKLPKLAAAKPN